MGEYRVRLDDDRVPNLFSVIYYRNVAGVGIARSKNGEFIKQKINGAQWLIDSIEQRPQHV